MTVAATEPASPAHILVVDESPRIGVRVRKLLAEAGFEVEVAPDPEEARRAIARRTPDLVLTELMLPAMEGLDLVDEIRAEHDHVPVVVMTAHGNEEIAVKALRQGAASYVPKRILERELVPTVEEVLQMARERRHRERLREFVTGIRLRFSLANDLRLIGPLVLMVQEQLEGMDLWDETGRLQVGMALHEAIANAMLHGNLEVTAELRERDLEAYYRIAEERRADRDHGERRVRVVAEVSRVRARFVVTDEGSGFDHRSLPDPTDPGQLEQVRGRGLLLIRTFMDEVSFNETGNEITLVKRSRPSGP